MKNYTDFYKDILDNLPWGVYVLDAKGNYLYVNDEYCQTFHQNADYFFSVSVYQMKEEGLLKETVWDQILERKKITISTVSVFDQSFDSVLTIGVPVLDNNNEIEKVYFLTEPVGKIRHQLQKGNLNRMEWFCNNQSESEKAQDSKNIIAESPQMKQILESLYSISPYDVPILITGASGSGKEVIANFIHNNSNRRDNALITLNCASIPENLLESELFGYEKGAFTGASKNGKPGLIELADNGTLFIDEINSMPLTMQTKFLRILETKQITRLGSVTPKNINFRIICATNEDLQLLIDEKRFRLDLFYRINVFSISIPDLNKRPEDIIGLLNYFMEYFCQKYNKFHILSKEVVNYLVKYPWPGNVRELRNFVEHLILTVNPSDWEIHSIPHGLLDNVSSDVIEPPTNHSEITFDDSFSYTDYMNNCERQLLIDAIETFKTPLKIAEALKINIATVYRKLQKHNLSLYVKKQL